MNNGLLNRNEELEKREYLDEVKQDCFRTLTVEKINKSILNELRLLYFNGTIPYYGETTLEVSIPLEDANILTVGLFNDKDFLKVLSEHLNEVNKGSILGGDPNVVEAFHKIEVLNGIYHLNLYYILKDVDEDFLFN